MNSLINDSIAFALPLFIIAIGGIYCEGSGVINLATEGFQGMGAFFGGFSFALVAHFFNFNSSCICYLSLVFALIGGGFFSFIYAFLTIRYKANQVVAGVVSNMLAVSVSAFLANQLNLSIFGAASNKFQLTVFPRLTIPIISEVPIIGAFFNKTYTFEYVIIIVALIMTFILYRTPYGMRLRACGDNSQAVATTGEDVNKIRFSAIIICGGLAGLGGMCFAYSVSANFSPSIFAGYGFLAIAAYIFGNWKIRQTLLACLIFGFARSFGYLIIKKIGLPIFFSDLVFTFPYILTLLLLLFFSKTNVAPRDLGKPYDKGRR
jgi:simple sugar transport system permease protein